MKSHGVIAAVARTLAYLGLGWLYTYKYKGREEEAINAILIGGVSADYVTWAFRTAFTLPGNILRGSYEACVNALFGWFVYRTVVIETTLETEAMAIAFLAFMLVMGIKVTYYSAVYLEQEIEDDAPTYPDPVLPYVPAANLAPIDLDSVVADTRHYAASYVKLLLYSMLENNQPEVSIRRSEPLPAVAERGPARAAIEIDHVLNCLKIMSGCNPVFFREPVDGRFVFTSGGRTYVATTRFEDSDTDSMCTIRITPSTARP